MMVKDEQLLLEEAIDSVRGVVDEIIVVDTGSRDATREIAARGGAQVFCCEIEGRFSRGRNETLRRARGDWVLVLDGDESIAARDAPVIRDLVERPTADAYWVTVRNYTRSFDLLSDWHPNRGEYAGEEFRSQCAGHTRFPVMRLFRRTPQVCYDDTPTTHGNPLRSLRAAGMRTAAAPVVIHHFQCRKGGEQFVARKQRDRLPMEQQHLREHPDDALAHLNVGRTLLLLGQDDAAIRHLQRAVTLGDEHGRAGLSLGIALFETRAYGDAAAGLEVAVANHPDLADAWTVLGMAYHALGRHQDAAVALGRALALRPWHPLALNSRGVLLMDLGQHEQAAVCFRRVLELLPEFHTARENLDALAEGNQPAAMEVGGEGDDV